MARWGMPTRPKFLEGRKTDPGVTNIRNVASSHCRRWLGPDNRCLVPFSSFAEPDNGTFGWGYPL
jgi:putative SOS response-associated peptidase YedK